MDGEVRAAGAGPGDGGRPASPDALSVVAPLIGLLVVALGYDREWMYGAAVSRRSYEKARKRLDVAATKSAGGKRVGIREPTAEQKAHAEHVNSLLQGILGGGNVRPDRQRDRRDDRPVEPTGE